MARVNVWSELSAPADYPAVITGWYDDSKLRGEWPNCTWQQWHDGYGEAVALTSGGRWVREVKDRYHVSSEYITRDEAREWLLAAKEDDAIAEHFGDVPAEEDRRQGRQEIGAPVQIRLGDLLGRVDEYAAARQVSRAEAVRVLVAAGLEAEAART